MCILRKTDLSGVDMCNACSTTFTIQKVEHLIHIYMHDKVRNRYLRGRAFISKKRAHSGCFHGFAPDEAPNTTPITVFSVGYIISVFVLRAPSTHIGEAHTISSSQYNLFLRPQCRVHTLVQSEITVA